MTPAETEKDALPSCADVCFDAVRVPANRRAAEAAWNDVFAAGEGRFIVSTGSIAGSAKEAESLGRAIRTTFEADRGNVRPASLLDAAGKLLRNRPSGMPTSTTALVGVVDAFARTLTYVSAGHPPPYLRYHDGTVAALPADGVPIGLAEREHPAAEVVASLDGVALLLFHSGMLASTAEDFEAGLLRLQRVLVDDRIAHCSNPAAWVARRMLGDVSHADAAVLALSFPNARSLAPIDGAAERPRWTATWSFDSTRFASNGARRAFLACLTSKAHADSTVDLAAAELIFGELLGNVVRHAPGPVEIRLDWSDRLPVLHVLDSGPGFRSRRKRERLPVDDWSESGRGLFIVNACAAQFSVSNRAGRGTHARATLPPSA